MNILISQIKEIAEKITHIENKRKEFADILKRTNDKHKLIQKISGDELKNIKVAGIDSGLLKKSLHGFDCVLVRGAGVCFHYVNSKIKTVSYYPSKNPILKPYVFEGLSDINFTYLSGLLRLKTEIKTAIECIDKLKPDVLLLHGPLIPHYSERPPKTSSVYKDYQELIDLYNNLYRKDILIAGIVEDSRSSGFCEFVKSNILQDIAVSKDMEALLDKTRDTNFLYFLLNKGERTVVFQYFVGDHPVIKDLGYKVYSFYLKAALHDRPFRVDTLTKDIHNLASVLLGISGYHSAYALPAPLIEADNIAKLSENDMKKFYNYILHSTGYTPSLMDLRREKRPF